MDTKPKLEALQAIVGAITVAFNMVEDYEPLTGALGCGVVCARAMQDEGFSKIEYLEAFEVAWDGEAAHREQEQSLNCKEPTKEGDVT